MTRPARLGIAAALVVFAIAMLAVALVVDPAWTTSTRESVEAAMSRLVWRWIVPGSVAVGVAVFIVAGGRKA